MTITTHEIVYHLDLVHMLKYLENKVSTYELARKTGISKSSLYYYKTGLRQLKNKGIYEAILKEYYSHRSKERVKRVIKSTKEFNQLKKLQDVYV
jgi:hypothetical protein